MKFLPSISTVRKICLGLLVVALSFLWLTELSKRRAREAADQILGPMLEALQWEGTRFEIVSMDYDRGLSWANWVICYDNRFAFDGISRVQVDMFGNVRLIGDSVRNQWLAMSDEERRKTQLEILKNFRTR